MAPRPASDDVKAGTRTLGVAESYAHGAGRSTLAGAVVRADRVVDGFSFESCTVGGTDATDAVCALYDALDREDVRYVFLAGIAPAWFNVLDLREMHDRVERPVLSVSFEESSGLADAISREFEGSARAERLAVYERQPERVPVDVNGERVFVRSVGCEHPQDITRAVTPEGGRPEPLRVARLAARAADDYA